MARRVRVALSKVKIDRFGMDLTGPKIEFEAIF
jgi:hypothetical protein